MKKIINGLLSFLKYIFLLLSFGLTLFIILKMYTRLNKSLTSAIVIFIPYLVLLFLFLINSFLKREGVTKNLFYNMTATLVFFTNIFVCLRAIFDKNMLFNEIQKMGVNFNYFNDYLSFNRIMLYGLIIGNIVFMFIPSGSKKKGIVDFEEESVAKKLEVKHENAKKENEKLFKKNVQESNQEMNRELLEEKNQELNMRLARKKHQEENSGIKKELAKEKDDVNAREINRKLTEEIDQEVDDELI